MIIDKSIGPGVKSLECTCMILVYSAGEEKSPLFIFLHDQLPLFLGEIVENFSRFLQEIQFFLQEIPVFLPEILGLYL